MTIRFALPRLTAFQVKAWLFGIGLGLALVGMSLELRWPVGVAVGLLGVAFLLRFAERRKAPP